MPNVRASSGMIGTIRGPSSLSRIRFRRIRVKTIVVENGRIRPPANSWSTAAGGFGSGAFRTTRFGTKPPRALRRSRRYWTSSESGPGW
jgi:hypothetical protein